MVSLLSNCESNTVCLLDNKATALEQIGQVLASAGLEVEPFTHPDAFLEYAQIHCPRIGLIVLGGASGSGLEVANRLRELSPATAVIFSLRIYRGRAQRLLLGNEFVNVIIQKCITTIQGTDSVQGRKG